MAEALDIKVDSDLMRDIVQQAILDKIGADGQERLVAAALTHLMTPPSSNGYSSGRPLSPLQEAFNRAVSAAADGIVRDLVQNDETFQGKIKTAVGEAMLAMDEANYSNLVGEAIGAALQRQRY